MRNRFGATGLWMVVALAACHDADKDDYRRKFDCDDENAEVHPGVEEVCNGVDDDCNGAIDDQPTDPLTWYADLDGDTFGNAKSSYAACAAPPGWVADATDCDDDETTSFPGNPEICDGVDNDCNGETDEGVTTTFHADVDGDAFGDAETAWEGCEAYPGWVEDDTDCDDLEPGAFPGAIETCDGVDNDCNDQVDEGVEVPFHPDADGDGFGSATMTYLACEAPAGWVSDATDCDDAAVNNFPGNSETCDGEDNDCDGASDDGVLSTYHADADGDQFGAANAPFQACSAPPGFVADATDCDDGQYFTYPGAFEYCDGVDSDCDGIVDNSGYDSDLDLIDNCNDPSVWFEPFSTSLGASSGWGSAGWNVVTFADMPSGNAVTGSLGFPVAGTPTTPEAWNWTTGTLDVGAAASGHSAALGPDHGQLNVWTLQASVGPATANTNAIGLVWNYEGPGDYFLLRWDDPNGSFTRTTKLELVRCQDDLCTVFAALDNAPTSGGGLTQVAVRVRYDAVDVFTGGTLRMSTIFNGGDLGPGVVGAYAFATPTGARFDAIGVVQP